MGNPLMGMMGGAGMAPQTNMLKQARQMMNTFRTMSNPKQMIMNMVQKNPESASLLQMAQGRNPEEIFREECQKRGMDADQVINALGLTPPKRC